jgi:Recombinase zinc beta ribbon domain
MRKPSELALCGYCGARLHWHESGNVGKGRQGYYRCSGRRHLGATVCSARMIPAKQIEPLVLDVLRALTISPRLHEAVITEVQDRLAQPVALKAADPRLVREQLRRLRAAYLAGDDKIDDVTYAGAVRTRIAAHAGPASCGGNAGEYAIFTRSRKC